MTPAGVEPQPGTPLATLGPEVDFTHHVECGNDVSGEAGVSVAVARHVASETDAIIRWPFRTAGWSDDEGRCQAVVLHNAGVAPGRVEIVGINGDLPWSRSMLRTIGEAMFGEAGFAEIAVRCPPEDGTLRRFLGRIGFVRVGAEARPGEAGPRHTFTLGAMAYRRRFPRRAAH